MAKAEQSLAFLLNNPVFYLPEHPASGTILCLTEMNEEAAFFFFFHAELLFA